MSRSPSNIKRPSNAWILYRSDAIACLPRVAPGQPRRSQAEISKIVARAWSNEDPVVKQEYYRRAEVEKVQHKIMHPDYVYRPRRAEKGPKQPVPAVVPQVLHSDAVKPRRKGAFNGGSTGEQTLADSESDAPGPQASSSWYSPSLTSSDNISLDIWRQRASDAASGLGYALDAPRTTSQRAAPVATPSFVPQVLPAHVTPPQAIQGHIQPYPHSHTPDVAGWYPRPATPARSGSSLTYPVPVHPTPRWLLDLAGSSQNPQAPAQNLVDPNLWLSVDGPACDQEWEFGDWTDFAGR